MGLLDKVNKEEIMGRMQKAKDALLTPTEKINLKPNASATFQENSTERSQEYAGSVQKCPNCGCTISDTVAICPDCGMHISGRAANYTIQDFKNQLMAIESSRKNGLFTKSSSAKADIQKLSLIKSFPIPNSISDILEFMLLAIANIDVNLSKKTFFNNNSGMETNISNAWVAKMEQCYNKAKIVFPTEPEFESIQKMYFDKMKELKIKIN